MFGNSKANVLADSATLVILVYQGLLYVNLFYFFLFIQSK